MIVASHADFVDTISVAHRMEFQVIDIFVVTVCSVGEVYYRDLVKVKVDCCFEVEVGLRSAGYHFEVQTNWRMSVNSSSRQGTT